VRWEHDLFRALDTATHIGIMRARGLCHLNDAAALDAHRVERRAASDRPRSPPLASCGGTSPSPIR
jgi:hypothetical protein